MKPELPNFSYRIFQWFCSQDLFEELQGDLEEAFFENVELHGMKKARQIYTGEILKMIRPSVIRSLKLIPSNVMRLPKNYLKTSIRAIKLNPFYVFANIFGLALAISICTIGYFNYQFNATFNKSYAEADNIYKISGLRTGESTLGTSSIALAPSLKSAAIEAFRYTANSIAVREHNHLFSSRMAFADSEFFSRLPMKSLNGSYIKPPGINEVAISAELAMKLFNEPYPVGKLIKLVFPDQKEESYLIKDVFETPPNNVSFSQAMITSFENYPAHYQVDQSDWQYSVDGTFVYASQDQVSLINYELELLKQSRNEANDRYQIDAYRLDTILEWPAIEGSLLHGRFRQHLHISSVYGIAGTAISILLLACFNFINTSIALSGKRLKEIAVRKIMGGSRKSTIVQFMIENTFMISMAVILSVGISSLLIPTYNAMFQRELIQLDRVPFTTLLQFALFLIIIVTLLSAAYPSLYVSKFSSLKIFRDKVTLSVKNRLMMVLLTFQFALCFYNIFGLFLNVDNSYFQDSLDRGYNIEQVVNIPLDRPEQFRILADQLNQEPEVQAVAGSYHLIGFSTEFQYVDQDGRDVSTTQLRVGTDYSEVMGLRLNKGSFHTELGDNSDKVVINRMLESQYGIDMLNQSIKVGNEKFTVIGVVDDFNVQNIMMDNKITPTIIRYTPEENYNYAVVRMAGSQDLINSKIEQVWYEAFPQELYRGFLQEDVMQSSRGTNGIFVKINLFMAIISILISILGLYTLVSLKVQKRSKEFGVRKVLGASRKTIIHLLGKDLYWILGVAAILGLSASHYILATVFDIIYAYHVSSSVGHFIKALLVVLAIVVLAIGYKVYQTSKINPAQQLRSE
ncbi:FtsX-like permease family protein [Ekhidna sp. To15]|uniref:FtsX-like permease family protein n=1 Tax=Ekhidna sp. To15 TaxID=3395267 RepID=UPI003F51FA2A